MQFLDYIISLQEIYIKDIFKLRQLKTGLSLNQYKTFKFFLDLPISINVLSKALAK